MNKGYWIGAYRHTPEPATLAAYGRVAGPAIEAAGGRFLVRGGRQSVRDQGVDARTTVIEFDSYEQALAAYESPAYRRALAEIGTLLDRDTRIVEGLS